MPRSFELDARHDIEFMRNNSKHGDINSILSLQGMYHARIGVMLFALNAKNTDELIFVLNHIDNTLDIIPLIDADGVRIGTFYREGNGNFSLKTTSIMQ